MGGNGATAKMGRVVQRDRFSGSYMEALCVHHEQPTMFLHHPVQRIARFQTGKRDRDSILGGETESTSRGVMTLSPIPCFPVCAQSIQLS